jgi:hypothetical protein
VLDDAADGTIGIAQHAPVAGGIVQHRGQNRRRGTRLAMRRQQAAQRLGGQQRRVTAEHQRRAGVAGEERRCLLHRVAGAELLLLERELQVAARHRGTHPFRLVADDDDRLLHSGAAHRFEDVVEQWLAERRMQHLRQIRLHAFADAGRQNDRRQFLSHSNLHQKRAPAWRTAKPTDPPRARRAPARRERGCR